MNFSDRTKISFEMSLRDRDSASEILQSIAGVIISYDDADVITFDGARGDWHSVTLGGNRTLVLTNIGPNQEFTILLTQSTNSAQTVVWFNGIRWAGGSPPNLSNKAGLTDVFRFKQIAPGVYLGFVVGLAF